MLRRYSGRGRNFDSHDWKNVCVVSHECFSVSGCYSIFVLHCIYEYKLLADARSFARV